MSFEAVLLLIPIYLCLQAWAAIAWTGSWRWAALAPLAVLAVAAVLTAYAQAQGSNVWPLPLILFPMIALAYLGLAALARLALRSRWPK